MEPGLAADHPVAVAAKQVRLELPKVKADVEQELGKLVLNCTACGQEITGPKPHEGSRDRWGSGDEPSPADCRRVRSEDLGEPRAGDASSPSWLSTPVGC